MNRRNFLKGLIALPAIGAMPLNVDAKPKGPKWTICERAADVMTVRPGPAWRPTSYVRLGDTVRMANGNYRIAGTKEEVAQVNAIYRELMQAQS